MMVAGCRSVTTSTQIEKVDSLKLPLSARDFALDEISRVTDDLSHHLAHLVVHAYDTFDREMGSPLRSTRKLAKMVPVAVTHTTVARIRARIGRDPERYEERRQAYLSYIRSREFRAMRKMLYEVRSRHPDAA
jgi:hypothetical protein